MLSHVGGAGVRLGYGWAHVQIELHVGGQQRSSKARKEYGRSIGATVASPPASGHQQIVQFIPRWCHARRLVSACLRLVFSYYDVYVSK
jgi:hypothetical protein